MRKLYVQIVQPLSLLSDKEYIEHVKDRVTNALHTHFPQFDWIGVYQANFDYDDVIFSNEEDAKTFLKHDILCVMWRELEDILAEKNPEIVTFEHKHLTPEIRSEKQPELYQLLEDVGLKEVTTKRQRKNGTRIFLDTVISDKHETVSYGIYRSGTVRRIIETTIPKYQLGVMYAGRAMYQLNRTYQFEKTYNLGHPTCEITMRHTRRIPMSSPQEKVMTVLYRTLKFRKTKELERNK